MLPCLFSSTSNHSENICKTHSLKNNVKTNQIYIVCYVKAEDPRHLWEVQYSAEKSKYGP
jgi:hypothetical protein